MAPTWALLVAGFGGGATTVMLGIACWQARQTSRRLAREALARDVRDEVSSQIARQWSRLHQLATDAGRAAALTECNRGGQ